MRRVLLFVVYCVLYVFADRCFGVCCLFASCGCLRVGVCVVCCLVSVVCCLLCAGLLLVGDCLWFVGCCG